MTAGFETVNELRVGKFWMLVTRLGWATLVILTLALFGVAIPARFTQLLSITPVGDNALVLLSPEEAAQLQQHGISLSLYALYFIVLEAGFAAIYVLMGAMFFWRKAGQGLGMFGSLTLFSFGVLIPATVRVLDTPDSGLDLLVHMVQVLGWSSFFTCFYIFPDGQFEPRWTRVMPILFAVWGVFWILFPAANAFNWPLPFALLAFAGVFVTGVFAQAYRYQSISTPSQRLQTKWVLLGFAGATLGTLTFLVPSFIWPSLQEPGWPRVVYHMVGIALFAASLSLIPISIDIAIRRYKLWTIDPIVNRALVYSLLTLMLALVYGASVILLQGILRSLTGQQQPEIVTVASTLIIAGLFSPLQHRIQNTIDRRFYRQRYDAAKTLAAFGATLRDEVDLDHLTDDLLKVVHETMAPAHVSLWLKTVQARREG